MTGYPIIIDRGNPYPDLYACFKQNDGSWSNPVNMAELNTPSAHEMSANVSPDERFIMFLSGRTGILLPYWIDASMLDNYR